MLHEPRSEFFDDDIKIFLLDIARCSIFLKSQRFLKCSISVISRNKPIMFGSLLELLSNRV
jgi:hypothetical protein